MLRCVRLVSFLLASALFAQSLPVAADDGNITVVTKSGSKFRGELVEEVPNDHVTIKLATGEVKRFAWDEISHDAPKSAEPAAPAVVAPAGPTVVIESTRPVLLERNTGRSDVAPSGARFDRYETVCRTPCKQRVAAGDGYRLYGDGLIPSKSFALTGTGTTKIDADLGSSGLRTAGWVLGIAGIGIGGGALIAALSTESNRYCSSSIGGSFSYEDNCVEERTTFQNAMLVVAGSAVVMSIVGFVIVATSRTTVSVDGREVARKKPPLFALTPRGIAF